MAYLPKNEEEQAGESQAGQIAAPQGEELVGAPQSDQQAANEAAAVKKDESQGSVQLSGASGDIQSGQSTGSEPAQASAPSQGAGTGFTQISQYLDQNTNQAAELANRVGGVVQDDIKEASEGIDSAQQTFNKEVQDNTVNYNQNLANQAASESFQGFKDENQANEFRRMLSASYQGPDSFESSDHYTPLDQSIQKAQASANQLDSSEGRKALLQKVQQSKRASNGVTSLNNLLLSNSPEAQSILEQSKSGIAGLDERLAKVAQESGLAAQRAKSLTDQTGSNVQNRFLGEHGVLARHRNEVDQRTRRQAELSAADQEAVVAAVNAGGELTDPQLARLGITREQYNKTVDDRNVLRDVWNMPENSDLGKYIQQTDPALLNRDTLATKEEYARNAALSDLLGIENDFLTNEALAGTGNLDNYEFDYDKSYREVSRARTAEDQRQDKLRKEWEYENDPARLQERINEEVVKYWDGQGMDVCFHRDEEMLMEDGSWKKVQDIEVGDFMMYGGLVSCVGEALATNLYEHRGIKVTGSHAVFENDQWIRVEDSKKAIRLEVNADTRVYPIVNENHIMIPTNEVIYADLLETDDKSMPDADRLKKMNESANKQKTKLIEEQLELGRSWRQEIGTLRMKG